MSDKKIIHVPIGGLAATKAPGVLATLLGSCVGFILQDLRNGVAVLAHVVRPSGRGAGMGPAYFADQAVPAARDLALRSGAHPRELMARLAGGGRMFDSSLDVGSRNVRAIKEATYALDMVFGGMLEGPRDGGCFLVVDASTGRASVRGLTDATLNDAGWRGLQKELER